MAQEFRAFTQRKTDAERAETRLFNVRAKTLVDQFGNDIVDSSGKKIWFPETFDPVDAIAYGKSLSSKSTVASLLDLRRNLWQGGPWDLQRSYNGLSNAPFAEVFTPAASYALGLIGAAAGFPQAALMAGGGVHNLLVNPKTAGANFGNNPKNPPFITQGFRDYFAPSFASPATIPSDLLSRNRAFDAPSDRFAASFDPSFNGLPDNFNGLAASVVNGSTVRSAGFDDPAANTQHGLVPSLPTGAMTNAPATSGGWLNSMIRNGEVERIAGDGAIGRWATTPEFQSGAAPSPALSPQASGSEKDQSKASVFESGAPPIRYLSSRTAPSSPNRQDASDDRFGNPNSSGGNNNGVLQPWLFYALTGGLR